MWKLASVVGILALFIGFSLPHGVSLGADKTTDKADRPTFVDLDGDGFDDNATPEQQDPKSEKPKSGDTSFSDTTSTTDSFFDLGSSLTPKRRLFLNNSSAFAWTKQRAASGCQSRGGFGSASDFGGGELGSGVVIGGVCVGGVCH